MSEQRNAAFSPPPLTHAQILDTCSSIFDRYRGRRSLIDIVQKGYRFRDVYERVLRPDYGIELFEAVPLGDAENGGKAIGAYDFQTNAMATDPVAGPESGSPKRTFMLYHEAVGHAVLQGEHLRSQLARARSDSKLVDSEFTLSDSCRVELERQANRAAAESAAPMLLVDAAIVVRLEANIRRPVYKGPGTYCLGHGQVQVADFGDMCRQIARIIQPVFDGLSVQALGYRVQRSRWVSNESRAAPNPTWRLFSAMAKTGS